MQAAGVEMIFNRCLHNAKRVRSSIDFDSTNKFSLDSLGHLRMFLDSFISELDSRKQIIMDASAKSSDKSIILDNLNAILGYIHGLQELISKLYSSSFIAYRKGYWDKKFIKLTADFKQEFVHLLTNVSLDNTGILPSISSKKDCLSGNLFELGVKHLHGIGCAKNISMAIEYFDQSVTRDNNPDSMLFLADWYFLQSMEANSVNFDGLKSRDFSLEGVMAPTPKPLEKAMKFLEESSKLGNTEAMYRLSSALLIQSVMPSLFTKRTNRMDQIGDMATGLFYYEPSFTRDLFEEIFYSQRVETGRPGVSGNTSNPLKNARSFISNMLYGIKSTGKFATSPQFSEFSVSRDQLEENVIIHCIEVCLEAADREHSSAQRQFGVICELTGLFSDAIEWYLKAAKSGDPFAYNALGLLYFNGNEDRIRVLNRVGIDGIEVIKPDIEKSLGLFQEAARGGCNSAFNNLGLMVERNLLGSSGVTEFSGKSSFDLALSYYKNGASTGNVAAMYNAGYLMIRKFIELRNHSEVSDNEYAKDGLFWLRRACDMGNIEASFQLGVLSEYGIGRSKDSHVAFEHYRYVASFGLYPDKKISSFLFKEDVKLYAKAASFAAKLIFHEKVGGSSFKEMMDMLHFSAKEGIVDSILLLSDIYANGDEIGQSRIDIVSAVKWLYYAVETQSSLEALVKLLPLLLRVTYKFINKPKDQALSVFGTKPNLDKLSLGNVEIYFPTVQDAAVEVSLYKICEKIQSIVSDKTFNDRCAAKAINFLAIKDDFDALRAQM